MHIPQMKTRECRPRDDERSALVSTDPEGRLLFADGLPIESHLLTHLLHDYFLAEIAMKLIEDKQDPMVGCIAF